MSTSDEDEIAEEGLSVSLTEGLARFGPCDGPCGRLDTVTYQWDATHWYCIYCTMDWNVPKPPLRREEARG